MPDTMKAKTEIEAAITGRRSIRAFRPDPVPRDLVEHLLDVAARAPSGTNMQPWQAYALAGAPRHALSVALRQAHGSAEAAEHRSEYDYYPEPFFEPFLSRRRKIGFDLYGLIGIAKGDRARMHAQHGRNLDFFDAPVGLVFTIHRGLRIGSWLDYGMFLENIMIAARSYGLETCVQAAFAPFHRVIREHLPIGPDELVVCGMAVGYPDPDAPENGLVSHREPARTFTTFLGFPEDEAEAAATSPEAAVTSPR